MKIWIMRHGEAGFNARSDSERTLTPFGVERCHAQGEWLARRWAGLNQLPDKILVSPYVRAQQTLQAVQAGANLPKLTNLVEIWDGITPMGDEENVIAYLDFLRIEGAQAVLLISHLPLVEYLTQALTQHQSNVHFSPAVIAEIDWNGKIGRLSEL